ncbi:MAG: DHH family phosphoesterase [Nanoarchaeota archaeon]
MEKQNNTFEEIWNKLKECKKILMTLHRGPDGDSLGSCAAIKYVLEKEGKEVKIVSPDDMAETLQEIEYIKEVEFGKKVADENLSEYDCVLFLDVGAEQMLAEKIFDKLKENNTFVINIDHHKTNSYFGNLNYVEERASTCSVLLKSFKELNIKIDKELAERLLLGICTDTYFFKYRSTAESLNDAAFLVNKGADYYNKIVSPILFNQPMRIQKYNAFLIGNMKINLEKRFCYTLLTKEDIKKYELNMAEIRMSANVISEMREIDFSFTLADVGDEIKGSLRSQKGVDVSLIAKGLGGGGHKPASGFVLSNMTLKEAEKKVLDTIEKIGIHKTS